jgi:hypothetical protein
MVRQQEQQAAEARTKNADRQNRIAQGLARIRMAFEGSPIMGSRQVATPGGVQTVTTPATTRRVLSGNDRYGNQKWTTVTVPGTTQQVATPGGTATEQYDTGTTSGGFDEDFFNRFRQGMLDTYMPQVEKQYGEAKDDLTYGLARAGTGRSSAAVKATSDLAEENAINRANIVTKADQGAGALRSRVADERAKAESQLYATEDPDVGANQALAAVKNISLATPDTTPLGDVFKTALVGGANALTGYRGEKLKQEYGLSSPRTGSSIKN